MVWNSIDADVRIVTFPVHLYSTEVAGRVLPGDGTRFAGACRSRLGGSSESGLHGRLCGRCLQRDWRFCDSYLLSQTKRLCAPDDRFPGQTDFGWPLDGRDPSSRTAAYAVTGDAGSRAGWHRVSRCSLSATDFFDGGVASYA